MIVAIGTANTCKVAAVAAVAASVPALAAATMSPFKVPSGIDEQPLTLESTRTGAMNRARAAFNEAKKAGSDEKVLAVGIESGLFCPDGDTGRFFDVCVCMATMDGEDYNMGLSCAFEMYVG
jgi:non-canonical (house-cleaning) NTP pyrophosphatase